MARKISGALEVAPAAINSEGAFNAFVDIDSKFYIDPHLLKKAKLPELRGSYQRFLDHFRAVIHLLDASSIKGDRFYREAVRRLRFREIPHLALGYSKSGVGGSGIGPGTATKLADTATEIINAGIKDPVIFELVGLIEEGIGADMISDMVGSIILPDILRFSERIAKNLGVPTRVTHVRGEEFNLPYDRYTRRVIVLLPKKMLHPLPVAYDWSDIDRVCIHNEELRKRVNRIIGDTWREATRTISKRDLRRALLENPEALKDLIAQYKRKPSQPYDFEHDPIGEIIWHDIAQDCSKRFPLQIDGPVTPERIVQVVTEICEHFGTLVEDNGLFRVFYSDSRDLRHERFAQLLFYGIADAYCAANRLDLSREPNAGRGPVDFKISKGYYARVTVEVKYSSNPQLFLGFTKQLPVYNRAEHTEHSIYLIIRTTASTATIRRLLRLQTKEQKEGRRVPKIIVVDGRFKPSASKAN